MSALFARLQLPWQDAAFVSVHGRGMNVVDTVRRNRLTFALTDAGSVNGLGAALCKAGFGNRMVHIGKNLGMEQEHVYTRTAADLARETLPSLTVLLFVNEDFDDRTPCGLPDSCFARLPDIPMTKSEIRALVLSRLKLRPADLCWDIGAGSGSVTAEAALHAWRGHVYAVERREASLSLIEENCDALHIGNVTVVCGEAPKALGGLPAPDAVLIGGSGGNLPAIFSAVLRANPNARIVVTAITPETVSAALAAFQTAGMDPEILQINVSRGRKAGGLHLMVAQNPVTILSAERQA